MIDHTIRELGAIALRVILPGAVARRSRACHGQHVRKKDHSERAVRIRVSTIFSKISVRIPAEVVAVARDAGPNGKP